MLGQGERVATRRIYYLEGRPLFMPCLRNPAHARFGQLQLRRPEYPPTPSLRTTLDGSPPSN